MKKLSKDSISEDKKTIQKLINREVTKYRSVPAVVVSFLVGALLIGVLGTVLTLSAQNIVDRDLMNAKYEASEQADRFRRETEQGITPLEAVKDLDDAARVLGSDQVNFLLYDDETGECLYPAGSGDDYELLSLRTVLHRYKLAIPEAIDLSEDRIISMKGVQVSLNIPELMRAAFENWNESDEEIEGGKLLSVDGFVGVALEDGNGGLTLYCRDAFHIYGYDVRIFVLVSLLTLLIILAVAALMIVSAVRSLQSGKQMVVALYHDEKSNGNNWMFFKSRGERLLRNKQRNYAVISLNNDKIYTCRSCYGGDAGDALLRKCFTVIEKQIGRREVVAHYADGTFALLLHYTNPDELKTRVQRLTQNAWEASGNINGFVHAGIYMIGKIRDEDDEEWSVELEHYYHHAGIACDSIQSKDDACVRVFDDNLYETHLWERKVETRMEEALANEEFVVYMQPKYDPRTRELKGAEALIRWISPVDGFISPGRFIPIFEEIGFITKIDDYMLKKVSALQARWLREGYDVIPVSVNISRAHFAMPDLAEHITEIVNSENVPHELVELELTESAFFDDKNALIKIVKRLQEFGFHVSMDDFGSGYSSLNSLKDLPLNVLKLDAEFFRGENAGARGELIVEEAIELGKKLNMEIVAEGVEKKEQVDFLAGTGCDMIQGFYFDKPLPIEEFETRMTRH